MAGSRDSVIGIRREQAIEKFLTARPMRFEPAKDGNYLCAVYIEIDSATGKALSIVREIVLGDHN
jgi:hypothetical protein